MATFLLAPKSRFRAATVRERMRTLFRAGERR
jgi:hypothetical protein